MNRLPKKSCKHSGVFRTFRRWQMHMQLSVHPTIARGTTIRVGGLEESCLLSSTGELAEETVLRTCLSATLAIWVAEMVSSLNCRRCWSVWRAVTTSCIDSWEVRISVMAFCKESWSAWVCVSDSPSPIGEHCLPILWS